MKKKIASLHYISQGENEVEHLCRIQNALDAGCNWIQLRMKGFTEAKVEYTAVKAKALCERHQAKLIINDYPEIARKVQANGVHLGLNDMPVKEARAIVGADMIIGGTANTFEDVLKRAEEKVDYVGLGPYRFTRTKSNLSPILGIEGYRHILAKMKAAGINLPVIAIGGITSDDLSELAGAGIHGIALSGAISLAENPADLVKEIKQQLDLCRQVNIEPDHDRQTLNIQN